MPNFRVEDTIENVGALEELQLDKDDSDSFISSVKQNLSFELFTLPETDGSPLISFDDQDQNCGIIDESFVLVVNHVSLDETLGMPLAIVHVDRELHW